jgi:hypothetical protein
MSAVRIEIGAPVSVSRSRDIEEIAGTIRHFITGVAGRIFVFQPASSHQQEHGNEMVLHDDSVVREHDHTQALQLSQQRQRINSGSL